MTLEVEATAARMYGLSGAVALVTGGGGGIGAAICETLAALGAGVHVADIDLDGAQAAAARITDGGGAAWPLRLDVTDAQACESAVAAIGAQAGGAVSILVACAGWTELHPVVDEEPGYWRRVTDICYLGTVHPCVAAMRAMLEAGRGGRIVTIGSEAGRLGNGGQALYAGAKAGVVGFTKSLAREGGRHGILANVVSPGVTDTPLLRTIDPAATLKMANASVLRRVAQPAEIAAAVAFLVSPCASFITGEVLSASGGLAMVS
jgi:2-hydroxycyclohexanecarboxyl-CoA dehydrogenase